MSCEEVREPETAVHPRTLNPENFAFAVMTKKLLCIFVDVGCITVAPCIFLFVVVWSGIGISISSQV